MKTFELTTFAIVLIAANVTAILLLWATVKKPVLGRVLFGLLFVAAGAINWYLALNNPEIYLDYRNFAVIRYFDEFIVGWFRDHILLTVGGIATAQILIAIGLQVKGILFKIAGAGAIIFLLAVLPLGAGAGFPATLIMAITVYFLMYPVTNKALIVDRKTAVLQ